MIFVPIELFITLDARKSSETKSLLTCYLEMAWEEQTEKE